MGERYDVEVTIPRSGEYPLVAVAEGQGQAGTCRATHRVLMNHTMTWHPIHLHGHTFRLVTSAGEGPRKDTVIVPAMDSVTVDSSLTIPASGCCTATTSTTPRPE